MWAQFERFSAEIQLTIIIGIREIIIISGLKAKNLLFYCVIKNIVQRVNHNGNEQVNLLSLRTH